MSDSKLCAEMLHRIFPALDVSEIKMVETQKPEKLTLPIRGTRFDVFTMTSHEIFDVEVQKKKLDDVYKRPRAYHIVIGSNGMDVKTLKESGNYAGLPSAYVIFICTFDPFSQGRYIYGFQNYCDEDKNKVSEDRFIERLDEKVREAKESVSLMNEYMKLLTREDERFGEGIEEGERRTQRNIYERLVASGKLSPQEVSLITGWAMA